MKASLQIEAIGDNVDQMMRFWTSLTNDMMPGLGDLTFGKPIHNYWVARITGHDPKYKYSREFIRGKKDYSHANSKGSRGIFMYYLLETGSVYEVKKNSKVRYFCKVSDDGEVIEITKDEVEQWIKNHSALILLSPQSNE